MRRIAVGAVLLLAISALVTACSTSSGETSGSGTGHNQQDATFAIQLNELSEQLITITDILAAKTDDKATQAKLQGLARIAGERAAFAYNWLSLNGRTNATAPPAPGLLTEAQFDRLTLTTGPALQATVAQVAKIQTDGMREIANAEISGGENAELVAYARQLLEEIDAESAILAQSA